jgi:HEAT repeat protein
MRASGQSRFCGATGCWDGNDTPPDSDFHRTGWSQGPPTRAFNGRSDFVYTRGWVLILAAGLVFGAVPNTGWTQPTSQPATQPATAPASGPAADVAAREQLERWIQYLTEENSLSTRKTACAEMLASGRADAIDALASVVKTARDASAVLAVCETLAETPDPPISLMEPLRNLLAHSDPAMREAAAVALGAYRSGQVVDALGQDITNPQLPLSRRIAAVRAMAQMHDIIKAIDVLIAAVDTPDARLRQEIVSTLHRLTPMEFGVDPARWREWWQDGSAAELLSGFRDRLRQQERQYEALEQRHIELLEAAFAKLTDQRDTQLLEWFKSPLAVERRTAVVLVHDALRDGKLPTDAIAAAARKLIDDADPTVRYEVVLLIRDLRQPPDAALLLTRLKRETDYRVRPAIFGALGRLGAPSAIPVCTAALNDPDVAVVGEAVEALGRLIAQNHESNGADSEPVVTAMLERFRTMPASLELRERVVGAMANIRDKRFAPILRAEASDAQPNARIRLAAVRGLEFMGNGDNIAVVAGRLADPDASVRQAAIRVMGAIGTTRAQLDALAARLSPDAEPQKNVQALAWDAYRAVFGRLSGADQLAVLKAYKCEADKVAAERFVQLASTAAENPSKANPAPADLAAVQVKTGDALAMLNRFADAAGAYDRALPGLSGAPPETQHAVQLKLLAARLEAGQFDQATAMLSADSPTTRPANEAVGQVIVQRVEAKIQAGDPDAAIRSADALLEPTAAALGKTWADKLRALRTEALAKRGEMDRKNVAQWVANLKAGGEPATSASVMIQQLGPRAVAPLKAEMRALLKNGAENTPLEKTLIDLLKQLDPTWPGYPADAALDAKIKALQ